MSGPTPRQKAAAAVARMAYGQIDEIEFDDAMVQSDFSETGDAGDAGLWVRAWVYVDARDIELQLGEEI